MISIENLLQILRNRPETGYKKQYILKFVKGDDNIYLQTTISQLHHPQEFDILLKHRMKDECHSLYYTEGITCFLSDARAGDDCNEKALQFAKDFDQPFSCVMRDGPLFEVWTRKTIVFLFNYQERYSGDDVGSNLLSRARDWLDANTKQPAPVPYARVIQTHKSLFSLAVLDVLREIKSKKK